MKNDRNRGAGICDEFVLNAYQDYSSDIAANLLLPTGLLIDRTTQYSGSLERFVLLEGDTSEVYSKSEIDFIDGVIDFCVFKEFYKKTKKGLIPCRVISAKIDNMDVVSAGIAFTKILNKALDGMNIGFIVSDEGLLFTGRLFERRDNIGCFVSNLIQTKSQYDEIASELMFCDLYDGFIEYYSHIKSVIHYTEESTLYGEKNRNAQRVLYAYIDELQDLQDIWGISFARQIERCFFNNETLLELTYCDRVKECEEYLFKIESSRVNTIEILFEAEEMERLALEVDKKNDEILQQSNLIDNNTDNEIDEETKALLRDPEDMIKILKKKRGI